MRNLRSLCLLLVGALVRQAFGAFLEDRIAKYQSSIDELRYFYESNSDSGNLMDGGFLANARSTSRQLSSPPVTLLINITNSSYLNKKLTLTIQDVCMISKGFECVRVSSSDPNYVPAQIPTPIRSEFISAGSYAYISYSGFFSGPVTLDISYLNIGGFIKQEYTNNSNLSGDPIISMPSSLVIPQQSRPNYSVLYIGYILGPKTGNINFTLFYDESVSLNIADQTFNFPCCSYSGRIFTISMIKDKLYYLRLALRNNVTGLMLRLQWNTSGSNINIPTSNSYYPIRLPWSPYILPSLIYNTYCDDSSGQLKCIACDISLCSKCENSSITKRCEICKDNATLIGESCSCNKGYYYENTTDACNQCPFLCTACYKTLGNIACTECKQDSYLNTTNECLCNDGFRSDETTQKCELCEPLCEVCNTVNGFSECQTCAENARLVGKECVCYDGYISISNKCIIPECTVSIPLNHNLSTHSIMDLSQECSSYGTNICEATVSSSYRYITRFNNLLPSLNLPYMMNYYLTILTLELGGLLYKDTLSNISKESLSYPLYFTSSGLVSLSGYISTSNSGLHTFSISTTLVYRIFILDDTNKVKLFQSSLFSVYLTSTKYYYIRIEIDSIPDQTFYIQMSLDNITYFSLSNLLYYPNQATSREIKLTSCNMTYTFNTIENDDSIRFCTDGCKECSHIITSSSITASPICNSCILYAEYSNNTCNCIQDYVFNLPSNRCKPPSIFRCLYLNLRLECLTCENGYTVGCLGDCCECDEGYLQVVDEPLECILPIENCLKYDKIDQTWRCTMCDIPFRVDPYGKCLNCESGYAIASYNPFNCIKEIVGCIIYKQIDSEWICDICGDSYNVGCEGRCCECNIKEDYIEISRDPLICKPKITHCIKYFYFDSIWGCSLCNETYAVDDYKNCGVCDEGYIDIKNDPLLCMEKIEGCSEYLYTETEYACSKCEFGYLNCDGKCCECKQGLYMSRNTPDRCSECPTKCKTCKEVDSSIVCYSCDSGHIVNNGACECDPIDFYTVGDECIVKPLDVISSSQENSILISFNKPLSTSLTLENIQVTFNDNLDTQLFDSSLIELAYFQEYILLFTPKINIDDSFNISLLFSDNIKDRQELGLSKSIQNMNLHLIEENITGRNEFCPQECSECELIGGRVSCSTCYDYAYLSDLGCICYIEGNDPKACPSECPEKYISNSETKTCIPCDECSEDIDNLTTDANIDNSKILTSYNPATTTSTTSVLAITTTISADKVWSLMNTIQIYTYLPLLQVNMTQTLKYSLKNQDSNNKYFDKLNQYVQQSNQPFEKARDFKYESAYLMSNIIKPTVLLAGLVLSNISVNMIAIISKGRILNYSKAIMNLFKWKVYLRFYIQLYLDIIIPCLLQMIYVICM